MFKGFRKKASLLSLTSTTSNESTGSSGTGGATTQAKSPFEKVIKQVRDFEIALQAMDFLLDDRSEDGIKLLQKESKLSSRLEQPHAILPLAQGVMEFIEATLGFESDVMTKAHHTLDSAESASLNNGKYNVKHKLNTSHIYPPGTEFQVTYAESTLLNALVMLLRENNGMVESAKALYKLRRAYHALDGIYKKIKESEPAFKKNLAKLAKQSAAAGNNGSSGFSASVSTVDLPGYDTSSLSSTTSLPEDVKLMKDLETVYQMRRARIEGTLLPKSVDAEKINLFEGSSANGGTPTPDVSRKTSMSMLRGGRDQTPPVNTTFLRDPATATATSSTTVLDVPPPSLTVESDASDDEFCDAEDSFDTLDGPNNKEDPKFFSDKSSVSGLSPGTANLEISPTVSYTSSDNSSSSPTHLHVSTIDEFIHSGVQLCFGILQVVLSLIPPTIGKVLSIVGFRGDRETGLKMLWRTAITSRNIHGELALLCLLVFYDGPVQFVDVGYQLPGHEDHHVTDVINIDNRTSISESELDKVLKNPSLYTPQLTTRARRHFPHNALWLLQECRILASNGNLAEAAERMQAFTDDPECNIQMQQIEALLVFDRAMFYCFKHDLDEAARDLISLIDINSWSKGLYLFMAGCCYLSKMRQLKMSRGSEEEISKYSQLAEKYMRKLAPSYVPGHATNTNVKKGGIGGSNKQMPFDKFLLRKLDHIEARQRSTGLPFVDCVGTSPMHELIYFWNGYNRMTERELALTMQHLSYSATAGSDLSPEGPSHAKIAETPDEAMIRYFLQSIALRSQGEVERGMKILDTHVISKYVESDTPFKFTRMSYSPYLYPTALYERSMFIWMSSVQNKDFKAKATINECKSWLKKAETVADIGDYELSNRTGMRIKAAADRLDHLYQQ
ncbi:inclusion body clearance protein Iml2p [[Candida] anglica]